MSGAFTPKFPRVIAHASGIVVTPSGNLVSDNVQAALEELQGNIDAHAILFDGKIPKTGIDCTDAGVYTSTLTYNESDRTITIAPTGASFDVFVLGIQFTKTSTTLAHTASQGGHFFYYDETGTLVHSLSPWDLLRHAPVAFVFWDAANSRGICFEERHHAGRDVWWHRNQHTNEGTKASSGFSITGYTEMDGTTDTAVTYSIATGRLEDEDIQVDTETLVDGGPYLLVHRSGASGDWLITRTSVLPFHFSANILQYNQFTGATWQLTNVTEDFYVNYWVLGVTALPEASVSPDPGLVQQYVLVPGQNIHATQAAADSENIASLAWGSIPFQELCPLYQVTLHYNAVVPAPYTNTARTAIVRLIRIVGTAASITATAQTDHGSLTGLSDRDHPASAIINVPAGNIIATDVQAAINELDTEKLAKTGGTGTNLILNGVTAFAEGSAALPSIIFDADPNTGIWHPAPDVLALSTAGIERLRVDAAGNFGIGSTATEGRAVELIRNITGNVIGMGYRATLTAQSDVTSELRAFSSSVLTQATAFTLSAITHYRADQSTFGAGSTVTNQYGLQVEANLIGATNNYAAYLNIPSGTNRWNLYVNGTAHNYLGSTVSIGATVNIGTEKLMLSGSNPGVGLNVLRLVNTATTANSGTLLVFGANTNSGVYTNTASIYSAGDSAVATTGILTFQTNSAAGTLTERMRIDSTGQVGIGLTTTARNNTRLQIVDGIGFPATQVASSDANTLDDYEEGTFTPASAGIGTAGVVTYTTQVGRYTKIGNRILYSMNLVWSSHTGTGDILITGLPFTSSAVTGNQPIGAVFHSNLTYTAGYEVSAIISLNATTMLLRQSTSGSLAVPIPVDSAASLYITGHYEI